MACLNRKPMKILMKLIIFFFFIACIIVGLTSTAAATTNLRIAKPGCPDECGGVKIPFPFGIKDGCFYRPSNYNQPNLYRLSCNTTTGKPVLTQLPEFSSKDDEYQQAVVSIDVDGHALRVSDKVAYACYRSGGNRQLSGGRLNYKFNMYPWVISQKNKLVVVGCDATARVARVLAYNSLPYYTGCMTSSCSNAQSITDGVCSGMGCCEVSVPPLMYVFVVDVIDSSPDHHLFKRNPCDFAFVSEGGGYKMSSAALNYSESELRDMQQSVLVEWAIFGRGNCTDRNSTDPVLCGSNAHCVDLLFREYGYRCNCSHGYSGNPYLSNGCQDIDECSDRRRNDCEASAICVNLPGSYECRCPSGYRGVGKITSPCVYILPDPKGATSTRLIVLGLSISLGSILALFFLFGLYKVLKRRKELKEREHNFNRNGGLLLKQRFSASDGAVERTKIFSQRDLEKATDNFNENRVLGRGGQGTVYKGMLEDGVIIAVKKSKKIDENQLAQFINEVVILSQINHRNVVQLFGCCLEAEVPMLVYEFVPNGTLYQHIHYPSDDFHITWRMRFQIAIECAGALAYLHSSSSCPIYHRDIKSSNILLDEKYRTKIADFGTSKTLSIDQTHVTTCVQGTFGYLDPEFFQSSQFTEKSDVYSFGVVLLELLTSKKPISTDKDKESRSLTSEFLQLMESPDELSRILDTTILHDCSKEEIQALTSLTRQCLNLNGKHRPTMQEVVMSLQMIRSKQCQVVNSPIEQSLKGEEGCAWDDVMKMADDFSSTTINTSAYPVESYSIEVHPLLFDSN